MGSHQVKRIEPVCPSFTRPLTTRTVTSQRLTPAESCRLRSKSDHNILAHIICNCRETFALLSSTFVAPLSSWLHKINRVKQIANQFLSLALVWVRAHVNFARFRTTAHRTLPVHSEYVSCNVRKNFLKIQSKRHAHRTLPPPMHTHTLSSAECESRAQRQFKS